MSLINFFSSRYSPKNHYEVLNNVTEWKRAAQFTSLLFVAQILLCHLQQTRRDGPTKAMNMHILLDHK